LDLLLGDGAAFASVPEVLDFFEKLLVYAEEERNTCSLSALPARTLRGPWRRYRRRDI
jgi:hypothetical protein